MLPGNIALGNRPLLNAVDRLAGDAIEDEHQAILVDRSHRRNRLAIMFYIEQYRWRLQVKIPNVVMNHLEVPQQLAGVRAHGDQAIGKEVIARTVDTNAVVVGG